MRLVRVQDPVKANVPMVVPSPWLMVSGQATPQPQLAVGHSCQVSRATCNCNDVGRKRPTIAEANGTPRKALVLETTYPSSSTEQGIQTNDLESLP